MIKWPSRALTAIVKLFEPLQEIDIYVEDSNDEVFYTHLFRIICKDRVRIARVFSKNGRENVISAAVNHDPNSRPSLFLIDGDLEWVRDEEKKFNLNHLYRLDAYCIENLLISEHAILKIIVEDSICFEEDAKQRLQFKEWLDQINHSLLQLFSAYAILNKLDPTKATVANRVGCLCTLNTSTKTTKLDQNKATRHFNEIMGMTLSISNEATIKAMHTKILARARSLNSPSDIISGKDFLLPLLNFKLQEMNIKISTKTLRSRLAHACDSSRFSSLLQAAILTAQK